MSGSIPRSRSHELSDAGERTWYDEASLQQVDVLHHDGVPSRFPSLVINLIRGGVETYRQELEGSDCDCDMLRDVDFSSSSNNTFRCMGPYRRTLR